MKNSGLVIVADNSFLNELMFIKAAFLNMAIFPGRQDTLMDRRYQVGRSTVWL
jgi:hypothetical protein